MHPEMVAFITVTHAGTLINTTCIGRTVCLVKFPFVEPQETCCLARHIDVRMAFAPHWQFDEAADPAIRGIPRYVQLWKFMVNADL